MESRPMTAFLAHFLILLSAWTLVIKFVFPVSMAAAEGVGIGTYIYWDFWWVAHLWLAYALLRPQSYTFALAVGVSVVEIIIVVTKFILFLPDPDWTIWTTNWFINKVFVLACFCLLLPHALANRQNWRAPVTEGAPGD